jgi:CHAD domain-containing protein
MSTTALPRIAAVQSDPPEDELGHIRDLVFIRDLLRQRGEPSTELGEYDAVINEARAQLAESAKRSSARYANAA